MGDIFIDFCKVFDSASIKIFKEILCSGSLLVWNRQQLVKINRVKMDTPLRYVSHVIGCVFFQVSNGEPHFHADDTTQCSRDWQ